MCTAGISHLYFDSLVSCLFDLYLSTKLDARSIRSTYSIKMATDANGSATATDYTIYHNYYSICSIQSRYVLKVRGKAANAGSEMLVQEQEVDIFNEEQLSEDYLIRINPKGQVGGLRWDLKGEGS